MTYTIYPYNLPVQELQFKGITYKLTLGKRLSQEEIFSVFEDFCALIFPVVPMLSPPLKRGKLQKILFQST